jgi:hypothetical protein
LQHSLSGDWLLVLLGFLSVSLFFLFVLGFGLRRGVGSANGFLPCTDIAVSEIGFIADVFLAIEKELGEVGEVFGAAGGDAAVGDELEKFADDMIDVGGGAEFTGDGFEFLADFVLGKELLLFASVDEAEGWVRFVTEHAALASVGERELAKFGWIDGGRAFASGVRNMLKGDDHG